MTTTTTNANRRRWRYTRPKLTARTYVTVEDLGGTSVCGEIMAVERSDPESPWLATVRLETGGTHYIGYTEAEIDRRESEQLSERNLR